MSNEWRKHFGNRWRWALKIVKFLKTRIYGYRLGIYAWAHQVVGQGGGAIWF